MSIGRGPGHDATKETNGIPNTGHKRTKQVAITRAATKAKR